MITTANSLPPEVQAFADETFLSVPTPNLIMKSAALRKTMPSRSGTTFRQSRMDRLPTSPVPLSVDGAPRPAVPLNRIDIDATVSFYGEYVAINQRVILQNQDAKMYGVFKSSLIDLEALA